MLDNIFEVLFLIGWIATGAIRIPYGRRIKQNRIVDDRQTGLDRVLLNLSFVGFTIIPLTYVLTSWLDFADCGLSIWAGWLGAVVSAVALWLFWRSHAELGHNFSLAVQTFKGHSLVTQGVYGYIRHPMYAAGWLSALAQALLLQNWMAGLSALVSLTPLYLYRIAREEQMLLEHFGEEYRSYMNRTGGLIPRFWR